MYLMLVHYSRGKKANREFGYSFLRRVQKAEEEPSTRELQREEAIAVKASLPRGDWLPWVHDRSGLSYGTVQRYMKLAREAEEGQGR